MTYEIQTHHVNLSLTGLEYGGNHENVARRHGWLTCHLWKGSGSGMNENGVDNAGASLKEKFSALARRNQAPGIRLTGAKRPTVKDTPPKINLQIRWSCQFDALVPATILHLEIIRLVLEAPPMYPMGTRRAHGCTGPHTALVGSVPNSAKPLRTITAFRTRGCV